MNYKDNGRYRVPSNEDYEPGSNGQVLKNYLGITSRSEIEALEEQELERTILELEGLFTKDYKFASEDLRAIHEKWLGDLYPIAGKDRSVNMWKDGFCFAASAQIPRLMEEFEKKVLEKHTPCNFDETNKVIEALAIVHVEFILIHPFREGNGRIARILSSLMANQAGLPPLDFESIDQTVNAENFKHYITAIHHGFQRDYNEMKDIFKKVIDVSRK